jgi:hypothetical protein
VAHVAGQRTDGLVDAGRLLCALEDGATVVLQSMQRWRASMAQFCRELEIVLNHPVQANAYLTPSGATGLAPHHDTHDVFVLQLHGTKRWRVSDPVLDTPLARHRSTAEEVSTLPARFEADLAPGDALYLPRGFVHSAQAQQGLSLHLTIGVLALTGHGVVRRLADLAAEELELRRALPPGWAHDPAVATAAVAAAMSFLTHWLDAVDPADVGEQLTSRFWSNRPPLLDGQLRQLELVDEVDDATVLSVRSGAVCRTRVRGGRLELSLGDRLLTLPSACEAAVCRLLAGPVELGDLADLLDEASRLVLARRLVREGLLVLEDPSSPRGASSP